MPIGTDLVLHEEPDPDVCKRDGERLGRVIERAARRYDTPVAFPLMDLTIEQSELACFLGVGESEGERFRFEHLPPADLASRLKEASGRPFGARMSANLEALRFIARETDLLPVGITIGPFSLMTKLIADPIGCVALAGAGLTAQAEEGVGLAERCLELALLTVLRSAEAQIQAGAEAVIVCEPAANTAYLSPRQIRRGADIFERFVLSPNRTLKVLLRDRGVDLILHDCGELTTEMVRQFAVELHPAMLSLGGSRKLWEDAEVVPGDVVLFGNLPTKRFYSDAALSLEEVRRLTAELARNMHACGHPHIMGSECDVLHVPEAAVTIRRKLDCMLKWERSGAG